MRLSLVIGLLAALASAQDEVKRHASKGGKYSVELPADWDIGPGAGGKTVFAFDAEPPGENRWRAQVRVWRVEGMRNPIASLHAARLRRIKEFRPTSVEMGRKPVPHVEMLADPNSERPFVSVTVHRVIRRVGFEIQVAVTPKEAWPSMRDGLLRACATFEAKIEDWPARPAGFKEVVKNGYVYLLQPGVKKATVGRMAKVLKKVEKDFVSRYGKLEKTAGNLSQIVVYRSKVDVPESTQSGFKVQWRECRLLATQLLKDKSLDHVFAREAVVLLLIQRFDPYLPSWFSGAERMATGSFIMCGKKLPWIDPGYRRSLPGQVPGFRELAANPKAPTAESFIYYALFRSGPKTYRKAFKAFVKRIREHEWDDAFAKHLATLDPAALKAAANRFQLMGFKQTK